MIRRHPARSVAANWIVRLACATCVAWVGAAAALAETVLPALARPVDQARFRVTAFATGLGYPTSMATLADGDGVADELNRVNAADLGVSVPNFGFADTYVRYSDGQTVGPTEGVTAPLATFRPVDGHKSEGAVELAFAPASFPTDFAGGLFVPFSGVFNQGGAANDENAVVFVDPETGTPFHFIESGVMGHPNGLLASDSGLFLTDLNPSGRFGDPIGAGGTALTLNGVPADRAGVVYLVSPTVAPVPEPSTCAMAVAALACGGFGMARRTRSRQP